MENIATNRGKMSNKRCIRARLQYLQRRKVFLFKKGDIESARNDLKIRLDSYLTNNPQDKSVDENYNFLTETVLEVITEHFPQKKLGSRWNVYNG